MVRQCLKEYHLRKSFTYFSITHCLVTINISGCASNEFSCPRGAPRCVAQSSRFCFSKKAKQTTLLNLKWNIASLAPPTLRHSSFSGAMARLTARMARMNEIARCGFLLSFSGTLIHYIISYNICRFIYMIIWYIIEFPPVLFRHFKSFSNILQCPDFQHDCGDGKCVEEWRRSAHCT